MSRVEYFTDVYNQSVARLSADIGYYLSFLQTSARMYKYPFQHQVMIHEQYPDATACAKADVWGDDKLKRRIKSSASKITLVDNSGSQPVQVFLYDISDTEKTSDSARDIKLWQINRENRAAAVKALGVESRDLDSALIEKAEYLAAEYAVNNLKDYSNDERYMYTELLRNSVAYMLLSRCGYNASSYFKPKDFLGIIRYDTMEKMFGIGCVISSQAEQILRTIEAAVKSFERSRSNERNVGEDHSEQYRVSSGRENGNIHAESQTGKNGAAAARKIRNAAEEIPVREPEHGISTDERARAAVQPLSGNRESSAAENEPDYRSDETGAGHDGAIQSNSSDGMGRVDEQYMLGGGGNSSERIDLRLNEPRQADKTEYTEAGSESPAFVMPADNFDIEPDLDTGKGEQITLFSESYADEEPTVPEEIEDEFVQLWYVCKKDGEMLSDGYATRKEATARMSDFPEADYVEEIDTLIDDYTPELTAPKQQTDIAENSAHEQEQAEEIPQAAENTQKHIKTVDDLRVGDLVRGYGAVWRITDINGDFSISFENTDKSSNMSTQASYGNWKREFAEGKYEIIQPEEQLEIQMSLIENAPKKERKKARTVSGKPENSEQITFFSLDETDNEPETTRSDITTDMINHVLRGGSTEPDSLERIVAYFQKGKSPEENAEFLRGEFKVDGRGFHYSGENELDLSAWFDKSGVTIAVGNSALSGRDKIHLDWVSAAEHIQGMLDNGDFCSEIVIDNAEDYELQDIANELWTLHQDISDGVEFFIPKEMFKGGFPDSTERIKAAISDKNTLQKYIDGLTDFSAEYAQNREIMRFHFHKPDELLQRLKDLQIPRKQFITNQDFSYEPELFITEDEKDKLLTGGGGVQYSKFRIAKFFKETYTEKEKIAFLKNEYGIGGAGRLGFSESHDATGISYRKGSRSTPDCETFMKWNEVLQRIDRLIAEGKYITQRDIDERIKDAKQTLKYKTPSDDHSRAVIEIAKKFLEEYGVSLDEETKKSPLENNTAKAEAEDIPVEITDEPAKESAVFMDNRDESYIEVQRIEGGVEYTIYSPDLTPADIGEWETEEVMELDEAAAAILQTSTFALTEIPDYDRFIEIADSNTEIDVPAELEKLKKEIFSASEQKAEDPKQEQQTEAPTVNAPENRNEPESGVPYTYHFSDDNILTGGAKSKFKANVEAIRVMKKIEAENRYATPEEQSVMAKYVGWGGIPQAFTTDSAAATSGWETEQKQLRELLTPEEYISARASVNNAHYTTPTVINAIYEGLSNLGFTGGNILEPALGVGNFFGAMPEEMRNNSALNGVEIDSVSGRIARLLYPSANIRITGFENTDFKDGAFDVAVGNVPFGDYKLAEKRYDKLKLNIHDHFFVKSLDKVREGGVVAFVTSKGTLDKANPKVRQYLAERAELLGAVRLPGGENGAFKANAGTEVTADIIFLQKRASIEKDISPDWVKLGSTKDGIPVNKYFEQHPEMILGEMRQGAEYGMHGNPDATACVSFENADLKELLKKAVSNIRGSIPARRLEQRQERSEKSVSGTKKNAENPDIIFIDYEKQEYSDVRNFSYTEINGDIYYREGSEMHKQALPVDTANRIRGMIGITKCVRTLIDYQLNEYSEADIKNQQSQLNKLYDDFTAKYGLISSEQNTRAFREDSSYFLLSSLEILDENGKLERKADMFSKRTIKPKIEITSVNNAAEALAVSLSEKARVDIPFMAGLAGISEEKTVEELRGVIYRVPEILSEGKLPTYVTADEYLSGNIREKLAAAQNAALADNSYSENVAALERVMPAPLDASEIEVRLGTSWIPPEYIKDFIFETLQTLPLNQSEIDVHYSPYTTEWRIEGKSKDKNNIMATMTFGTERKNAYSIIEDTLNLRDARVYDYFDDEYGKTHAVLNQKDTALAQEKQELLKNAFKDWVFKDPERREWIVNYYNEHFNSTRPREYDGSHLSLVGMNPEITLRPHQLSAIAHTIYGGNTLLAHQVGAGKTYEMAASAMESKRLGLCSKSLFVVPNHLTEQMGAEFLRLYPTANVLVATRKDFEASNRKRLCAKTATGNYDAIIIGHSQLEKIPVSRERQEQLLRDQIADITDGIEQLKAEKGEKFSIKQLEKTRKNLKAKLERLLDSPRRDDVVTFEELGIDKMFVDEAHMFKNLFLYTKMRNVAGLQQSEAQKSSDLYMKCQYLDELTGGKGTVFATGTPVSNSMTELYTMMRYLQSGTLNKLGLQHFDSWASNFGETATAIELAPEGTGYRAKTRFSKFFNLPELMKIFKEAADIKTADMLNLPVPEAHFHNVAVDPSPVQKEMVAELSTRAKLVHDKRVEPDKDNMLTITNDGRKIGLDQRLMNPLLPDEPGSKVNACINNVFDIYTKTADKKSTQIVFCDFSTPKGDGSFNLYDDIRNKLAARGVPKAEIAFIHEADTEIKKKELFAKVRQGSVRVLIGSTSKCGAGTNIQDKLIALHHLDCPWRPADLEQREGRIIRQGNENAEVDVYRYVTKDTFDAYLYQMIENKQRFISQIMTSKSPVRSCEDVDEATLSYAEVKALCAGNPLIKEKMNLDVEVAKLKVSKANHNSQLYSLEDKVRKYIPQKITMSEQRIAALERDLKHVKAVHFPDEGIPAMTIGSRNYIDKERAGKALLYAVEKSKCGSVPKKIGEYMGFTMSVSYDSFSNVFNLDLKREASYRIVLSTSDTGNITRINNALTGIDKRLESEKTELDGLHQQLENAKAELKKPYPKEAELQAKLARLAELNTLLSLDNSEKTEENDVEEKTADKVHSPLANAGELQKGEIVIVDKAKPSILAQLKTLKDAQRTDAQQENKRADLSL